MTEKDAVKYAALIIEDCWYLPVQAQFAVEDQEHILERVQNVIQK
jgi:tetraacyldisaccharide-1-P 4'-kinase